MPPPPRTARRLLRPWFPPPALPPASASRAPRQSTLPLETAPRNDVACRPSGVQAAREDIHDHVTPQPAAGRRHHRRRRARRPALSQRPRPGRQYPEDRAPLRLLRHLPRRHRPDRAGLHPPGRRRVQQPRLQRRGHLRRQPEPPRRRRQRHPPMDRPRRRRRHRRRRRLLRRAGGERHRAGEEQGLPQHLLRHLRSHRVEVHAQYRALDLRHLDAGEIHRRRHGARGRQQLVLHHRRLRLRPCAGTRHQPPS